MIGHQRLVVYHLNYRRDQRTILFRAINMRLPTGTFYRRFPTGGGTTGSLDYRSTTGARTAGSLDYRSATGTRTTWTFDARLNAGSGATRSLDYRSAAGTRTAWTFNARLNTGSGATRSLDSRSATRTFDHRIIQLILMLSLSSYFLSLYLWPRLIVVDTPCSLPLPTLAIVP